MKIPFIKPRFTGSRFDEHTLPVDVSKDLAAYQTLIVELAKYLYLKEHPERQRTPKGFGAAFELHLSTIGDGSAMVPLLALTTALATEPNANTYFEQARELVTACIAAPGALPDDFPKDYLWYFNQVGSSLKEGESMELPSTNGVTAVLTPTRRKTLVLAQDTVYERPMELIGYIGELDWERNTFRLRLTDGSQAIVPMPSNFATKARLHGGSSRHQVVVKCIASYDSYERLQKVDQVETISLQANFEIATKLDALASLENGWYDSVGKAPSKDALAEVTRMMVHLYPEELNMPAIVPTPEGNILLEWNQSGEPSVDINLAEMQAEFHAFGPTDEDIEQTFPLKVEADWKSFFRFLGQHIERTKA